MELNIDTFGKIVDDFLEGDIPDGPYAERDDQNGDKEQLRRRPCH